MENSQEKLCFSSTSNYPEKKKERGKGDRDGEHMYHGWFMSMYGKNHYNIVK